MEEKKRDNGGTFDMICFIVFILALIIVPIIISTTPRQVSGTKMMDRSYLLEMQH